MFEDLDSIARALGEAAARLSPIQWVGTVILIAGLRLASIWIREHYRLKRILAIERMHKVAAASNQPYHGFVGYGWGRFEVSTQKPRPESSNSKHANGRLAESEKRRQAGTSHLSSD